MITAEEVLALWPPQRVFSSWRTYDAWVSPKNAAALRPSFPASTFATAVLRTRYVDEQTNTIEVYGPPRMQLRIDHPYMRGLGVELGTTPMHDIGAPHRSADADKLIPYVRWNMPGGEVLLYNSVIDIMRDLVAPEWSVERRRNEVFLVFRGVPLPVEPRRGGGRPAHVRMSLPSNIWLWEGGVFRGFARNASAIPIDTLRFYAARYVRELCGDAIAAPRGECNQCLSSLVRRTQDVRIASIRMCRKPTLQREINMGVYRPGLILNALSATTKYWQREYHGALDDLWGDPNYSEDARGFLTLRQTHLRAIIYRFLRMNLGYAI